MPFPNKANLRGLGWVKEDQDQGEEKPDPINQAINKPLDVTQGIQRGTRIVTGKTNSIQGTNSAHDRLINNNNPFMLDVPLHPDPLLKIPKQHNTHEISHNPNINLDFKENSLF